VPDIDLQEEFKSSETHREHLGKLHQLYVRPGQQKCQWEVVALDSEFHIWIEPAIT